MSVPAFKASHMRRCTKYDTWDIFGSLFREEFGDLQNKFYVLRIDGGDVIKGKYLEFKIYAIGRDDKEAKAMAVNIALDYAEWVAEGQNYSKGKHNIFSNQGETLVIIRHEFEKWNACLGITAAETCDFAIFLWEKDKTQQKEEVQVIEFELN